MSQDLQSNQPDDRPGILACMFGVIVSPGNTYEALRDHSTRWDWLVPTVIVALVGMVAIYLTLPLIQEAGRAQVMEQMKDLPESRQEEVLELAQKSSGIAAMVGVPLTTFVMLFVAGGVLLLIGRFALGGDLTYGQALVVWAYASLVGVISSLVRVPLMLAKGTAMVHTGPAVLLSDEALSTFVGRLLAYMDLFVLWEVALAAIGLAVMTRSRTGKAFGYLFVIWLVAICGLAALSRMGAAL